MIFTKYAFSALFLATVFTSCSSDDDSSTPDAGKTEDVVSSFFFTGTNSEGTANYIATANSLDEGVSTIIGNGLETFTGTEWFCFKNKYLFRLQYNQGNNGGTSAYFHLCLCSHRH